VTSEANIAPCALACPMVPKEVARTRRKLVDIDQFPLQDLDERQEQTASSSEQMTEETRQDAARNKHDPHPNVWSP